MKKIFPLFVFAFVLLSAKVSGQVTVINYTNWPFEIMVNPCNIFMPVNAGGAAAPAVTIVTTDPLCTPNASPQSITIGDVVFCIPSAVGLHPGHTTGTLTCGTLCYRFTWIGNYGGPITILIENC